MKNFNREFEYFVNSLFPYADEYDKYFFKVKGTGQQMVYVIIDTEVNLVADEDYRAYDLIKSKGCFDEDIIERERFSSESGARRYVNYRIEKFENGLFEEDEHPYRIRRVPIHRYHNLDAYLQRGDHLQRDLNYYLPASHEGVYLGNMEVAHINTDEDESDFNKRAAVACIHNIRRFVKPGKELRIVVHCIERRTPSEICQIARKLVSKKYAEDEYHVINNNCQHFAWLCTAKVDNKMTDYHWIFHDRPKQNINDHGSYSSVGSSSNVLTLPKPPNSGNSNVTKPKEDDDIEELAAIGFGLGAVAIGVAAVGLWKLFSADSESAEARRNRERRERNQSYY